VRIARDRSDVMKSANLDVHQTRMSHVGDISGQTITNRLIDESRYFENLELIGNAAE
jgi:hypothetical protein